MIVTVFGDVHGNLIALEKLFEIEKNKTDLFICHGDVINYGPWSNECISFLSEMMEVKLLKGNHEYYFCDGKYPGKNIIAQSFFDFCYPKLNGTSLEEISKYGKSEMIAGFEIKHTVGDQYIFADTDISDLTIDLDMIIGHSHQQYVREKGIFKIYNTGSLGQNRAFLNQSCYLKIDTVKKSVELKSFIHDVEKVINEMVSQKYPQICLEYYLSKKRF